MNAPDQYGVVGHPINHSWSPFIHGLFAKQTEQSLVYRLYDIAPGDFRAQVLEFFTRGGRGLNVTVPHKEAAAELANELTMRADRAGAVNTLMLNAEHTCSVTTPTAMGWSPTCARTSGLTITNERILILGAGGATRGVIEPLLVARPDRARDRQPDAGPRGQPRLAVRRISARSAAAVSRTWATSPSTSSSTPPPPGSPARSRTWTARSSRSHTVCYDMSYSKSATPFVTWAIEQGCARAHKGWGMLVEQAAESFTLWRGVRPDTEPVLAVLGTK